jgi:hypothetical protein
MKLLRILSAALLLSAAISYAQIKEGDVVADVPFAFIVGGSTLPPGHYVVSRVNPDDLAIHDRQNHVVFVFVHSAQRSTHENSTRMVFHRYGDTYFLSEVWVGGNTIGRALFPSAAERKLTESGAERELAVVRMGK